MTRQRLTVSSAVVLFASIGAVVYAAQELAPGAGRGWQIAGAFPKDEPGPLEQRAKAITPENPIPRRTRLVRPAYPPQAAVVGVRAAVTLRLTLDHLGTVGEVRTVGVPVLGAIPPGTLTDEGAFTAGLLALVRSAKDAVGQWLYEPPAEAPVAFDVVIGFSPEGDGELMAQSAGGPSRPIVEPAPVPGPKKVKHVNPIYPDAAREAKIAGIVIVEAGIDAVGRVASARILRSIPELDDAALEAVRQWEFAPTLINGVPAPDTMTITIQFSLP